MFSITEKEFHNLATYIKNNYGINLREEKKAIVVGRLYNVLQEKNINNFTDYYKYVFADKSGAALTELINRITTNHTFFMREAKHFYYLRDHVLPFLAKTNNEKDLRIWSAGCSTGEEPVTLAMIIDEFFGINKAGWDTRILATDISSRALNIAQKGIYNNESITSLPTHWKRSYFKPIDVSCSILVKKIKNEIIYRKFNLMEKTLPFRRKFHVIFCRNVMIYFDEMTKMELVNKFYDLLEPGGYLFIGHSESLNDVKTRYKYIMPAIYRKE